MEYDKERKELIRVKELIVIVRLWKKGLRNNLIRKVKERISLGKRNLAKGNKDRSFGITEIKWIIEAIKWRFIRIDSLIKSIN